MNGLTPTDALRYINRNLGVKLQEIELTQNEIMDIVFQETLPTYSKYFPHYHRMLIPMSNKVVGTKNTYYINPPEGLTILGIHKIWVANGASMGHNMMALNYNPIETQLLNDMMSQTVTPVTWEFLPPNMIRIMPALVGLQNYLIEVKAVHPQHLGTIKLQMRDHFLKLALLDVLVSLYPLRKRFQSINSPFGSIEPFLEQVESASGDRQQLLEQFHENILKDGRAKRLWIK